MTYAEMTTLQVTNMPHDVTDRELYLLFGSIPGFEKSLVVRQEGQAAEQKKFGFVKFHSMAEAQVAKSKIDKFCFIPRKSDDFTSSGIKPENDMTNKVQVEFVTKTANDWQMWSTQSVGNIINGAMNQQGTLAAQQQPQQTQQAAGHGQVATAGQEQAPPAQGASLLVQGIPDTVNQDLFDAFIQANFAQQYSSVNCVPSPNGRGLSYVIVNFNTVADANAARERMDQYPWTHQGSTSSLQAMVTPDPQRSAQQNQQPVVVTADSAAMPAMNPGMGLLGDNVQQAFGNLGVGGGMFANQQQNAGVANGGNTGLIGGLNNTMSGMNMSALNAAAAAGGSFPMAGLPGYQIPVAFGGNPMFQQQPQSGVQQQGQQQQPQPQQQQNQQLPQQQQLGFGMHNMQNMQQMQNMLFQQQMQQPGFQSLQSQAGQSS